MADQAGLEDVGPVGEGAHGLTMGPSALSFTPTASMAARLGRHDLSGTGGKN